MIMLTGGAGSMGSHVCIALLDAGFDVVTVDNLSNRNEVSHEWILRRIKPSADDVLREQRPGNDAARVGHGSEFPADLR
ncbi:NAD-dependent epimerase/dehydratase family protein [Bradyrhizobium sp. USDA 4486]